MTMGALIFLIFLLIFLAFLFGLFAMAERRAFGPPSRGRRRSSRRRAVVGSPAASLAMRRAGYEAGPDYVQVTDIGLLAYRQIDEPKLVRYSDVFTDTQFLRPFAEIWLPYAASGNLRFELIDGDGRLRYADNAEYDLEAGTNTILPNTWLPLKGKTIKPHDWQLRLLAGEVLLATHIFGWQTPGDGEIKQYAASDGELSPILQQAVQSQQSRAISLSELLADQEE